MNKAAGTQYEPGVFPRRIEIELAASCNLSCTYCPRKFLKNKSGFMEFRLFKKLIDEAAAHPDTILVLHRRGESLLNPEFERICGYVKGKFREVQLATNATLLDEARSKAIIGAVNFVSFSIDVPIMFDRTRIPARYGGVEAKIRKFLELNAGKIRTQVSMVKTAETPEGDTALFKKIWKNRVDRIRIYEEHSRNGRFGSLERNRGERVPCAMPFYELLIFYDGMAGRCNHDWNGAPMGDANKKMIKDIWNSACYKRLREEHMRLDIKDATCGGCDSWYPRIGMQDTGETIE